MAWQGGDAPEARFDVITVHFRQAVAPATYELKANLSARQVFDREMKRVTVGWVRKQMPVWQGFRGRQSGVCHFVQTSRAIDCSRTMRLSGST
ncbi:hypothetical protein [Rhizobium leguminosarum]|uniref:hypothetical protein n=1 Tax=Rhizobium leguminosarum TaxID=384 RepID=UPI001C904240|nr:hypothetical protein [Rhizobium leguminosarum]